ncbi:MAG: hypothetical protein MJZ37_06295 [Bacilli bacterium]|nr:hypothetical protein [Bacilli bacterium]
MDWKQRAVDMSINQGLNARQISKELGVDYERCRAYIKRYRKANNMQRDCAGKERTIEDKMNDTKINRNGEITYNTQTVLEKGQDITPESIMAEKGLVPEEWEVVSFTKNVWQSQTREGEAIDLCQSKLTVRPNRVNEITFSDIDKFLEGKTFKNKMSVPKIKYNASGEVLEIDIADLHCGLLAWRNETGSDYDLHLCAERFLAGIKDIVVRANSKLFKDIYFCCLGDVIHIDNDMNTTTKGTIQQADGRIAKIFDFAFDTINTAIDMLRPLNAKIHYMYLCGNHDRNTGYYLAKCLHLANPDVDFDIAPNPQKAIHFGNVLVGLTHGDMPTKNKGTWLMHDYRKEFGESLFVEEHCGHIHTEESKMYNGIMVRSVMAQCGNSYWEHQQGYRSMRGIMCFVWNKEKGLRETWYYYDI